MPTRFQEVFERIVGGMRDGVEQVYGERLVSLAVFGSVATGTMRPDSDIDVLVVVDPLPEGRMARVREFERVERTVEPFLDAAARQGVHTILAPVFKTPNEVRRGSPLFLDMTHSVRILFDRDRFLTRYLADLGQKLEALGARRVRKGGGYYWLLTPDFQPGDVIEL